MNLLWINLLFESMTKIMSMSVTDGMPSQTLIYASLNQ